MTLTQVIKKNKLLVAIGLIYLLLYIVMPDKALNAIKNSVYYLIEMFQVLPVVFILTVVIEALVPKELIIKRFGENSGFLGNILSLLLGSISAGPIYAAFPISKMLLSKGARVSNIVIILSSWAVIKVPMLVNEVKFLGASFMGTRWILTVIVIFIMGWVTEKIIDRKELRQIGENNSDALVEINKDYCVGCGICTKILPEVFEINDKKALVKINDININNKIAVLKIIEKCPTRAIVYNGEEMLDVPN